MFFLDFTSFAFWVVLSLLLFILSPSINIFIRRLESKLSFSAYNIFLKESLFSKSGRSSLWQSKNLRDRFLSSIGSDASDYLGLILFISMDIYSFVLSIVLGVLTLSLTIDISLLPAFLFAGVLSFFVYRRFSKEIEVLYNIEQSSRTSLGSHLLKSWDNVLLNNSQILNNFKDGFINKFNTAQRQAMNSNTAGELLVFSLGLTTGIPVLISVIWILWNSHTDTKVLIALLATLPRQLNILGVFRNIFQSLTSLLSIEAKFDVIKEGTQIPQRSLEEFIKPNMININNKPVEDLNTLTEMILKNQTGRFEVRGPNGAGKSSLLLHLNHHLPGSVYLPTHPDLMVEQDSKTNQSSGEKLLSHITAFSKSPEHIILLDEWDANLDDINLHHINLIIDELAKSKTVIEVRHRSS